MHEADKTLLIYILTIAGITLVFQGIKMYEKKLEYERNLVLKDKENTTKNNE